MARGLPAIPRPGGPAQMQETQFGGLNMTNACRPGELEECRNLSSREYPCLSHRPGRTAVPGMDGVTAVFDHGGKLVTVRNGRLFLGEKNLCAVAEGPKQFAVVNSQLVVWPDGIAVSLTEERVLQDCSPVVTADDSSTKYDGGSIEAPVYIPIATSSIGFSGGLAWYVYTYGNDLEKFLGCWDGTAWDMEKLALLRQTKGIQNTMNQIVLLDSNGDIQNIHDTGEYDMTGLYGVISGVDGSSASGGTVTLTFGRFHAGRENKRFVDHFFPGDWTDISGGPFGLTGAEHAAIEKVDDSANKITFSGADVIRVPVAYCNKELDRIRAGNTMFIFHRTKPSQNGTVVEYSYEAEITDEIPAGCVAFFTETDTEYAIKSQNGAILGWTLKSVRLWHPERKETYGPYNLSGINGNLPDDHLTAELYPAVYKITINHSMPSLDYICAADNRLWGISNEDKTIWGSSLGKPFDFYTYAGLSTDSYAVAVSSDGEFTGCCEVGGYVAFFQEERVHLLMGSEPSEYATYSYGYKGVQAGSHGSLTMINERLYYLADDGVYSFSASGAPQLMTYNLGTRRFRKAVAGTDGRNYFISMQDRDTGVWGLFVLDTLTGIWLQEDETEAACFTDVNGSAYMAADGVLWKIADTDSDEKVRWSATFCRTEEGTFERKDYSRLLLRYEMEEGSSFKAEISRDGGPWQTVKEVRSEKYKTSVLPIRPGRCDSFRVRISGEGKILLRSMQREVIARGRK